MNAAQPENEAQRPAIPVRNAWYLLLYAWDLAAWKDTFQGDVEASPSMLGLLASILAASTRSLLRRHLARSFSSHEETIEGVRGRIDIGGSIRRLAFEAGRAHCAFPQLTVDTPRNRIIRATLDRLARDPRVALAPRHRTEALRHELRGLVRALADVPIVPVTSNLFRQLSVNRNDRAYALPLAICGLVHRLELPTEFDGDHALAALLRDDVRFHDLFERFIRNFWRTHLEEFEVGSEELAWPDELRNPMVPSMKTDVTLVHRDEPHRRIVVDAKYYRDAIEIPYGQRRFLSPNLYQLYAYLRTQEARSDSHRTAEGMLLYPTNGTHLDEAMKVQGHEIRVATVDLGQPWDEIHRRLVDLIRRPDASRG